MKSNTSSANGKHSLPQSSKSTGQKEYTTATSQTLLPTPTARDGRGSAEKTRDDVDSLVERSRTKNKKWSSLQEASLASHSLRLDEDKERATTATSGRICSESYRTSSPTGSLLKTFVDSLLGAKVWYSRQCALSWKTKVTKSSRLLFQLSPSARHIGGIESGLSLATPTVTDAQDGMRRSTQQKEGSRHSVTLRDDIARLEKLLPTPDSNCGARS